MAPLRHAVRLVDHEQRHLRCASASRKAREAKRSGAASTSCVSPAAISRERLVVVALLHARREHRRVHARLAQPAPLVGHQRDQRADDHDQRAAGQRANRRQRRQLVAQRLAAAGRHHDEAVAPVERRLHRLALAGAERVQPEALEQRLGARRSGRLDRCLHLAEATPHPGRLALPSVEDARLRRLPAAMDGRVERAAPGVAARCSRRAFVTLSRARSTSAGVSVARWRSR